MAVLTWLQGSFVNQPSVQIPIITNRWVVGFFFLVHIIFGSFTMGALLLAPTYEWIGLRREDPRFERYARTLASANQKVFSLGATLGGFAVIVTVGLYGKFFVTLFTIFFWPAVVAFSIWFFTIAFILLYYLRWDQMRARRGLHIAVGYGAAATEHIFLIIIVALDSYMLTPGSGLGAFFNASYFPELGHRFVGNLSWASFFIAAIAAVYAAVSRNPANRLYFHWAARISLIVGFVTLVIQIALGAIFVESIKHASPGAYQYSLRGPFSWLWLIQATFIGVLLVGSNLYFAQSRRTPAGPALTAIVVVGAIITLLPAAAFPSSLFWLRYVALGITVFISLVHWLISRPARVRALTQDLRRSSQVTLAVTGACALLLFLLMGVIRETARSNYTIYGVMTEQNSYGIFQTPSKGFYP
jgi:cytochrome bd-type quinol oxidase subunit 1